jgi:hypothetical protein
MCNMAKTCSLSLPLHILLILAVCVCSLAMHFFAEGLAPVSGGIGLDLTAQGGHAHLADEHSEDNFIFPFLTFQLISHPAADLQAALATGEHSFSTSPLLPPPNS